MVEDELEQSMDSAVEAIIRLCRAGAMVGLYKGVVGAEETEFMGEEWSLGGYFCPIPGRIRALLKLGDQDLSTMPRAKLSGMLSYWRQFIPDFSAKTRHLWQLLGQDAGDWMPAHTEEVRAALQKLLQGAPCINFDPQHLSSWRCTPGQRGWLLSVYSRIQQLQDGFQWLATAPSWRGWRHTGHCCCWRWPVSRRDCTA